MAIFTKGFIPNTSSDGKNLLITDTSVYNSILPKTVFSARSVLVTKADGTQNTYNFPYTNTDNSIQDILTITDYFTQDFIVNIKVTWTFTNEGDPDEEDLTLDYLSNYNSLLCKITLSDTLDCDCGCDDNSVAILNSLNRCIDDAILWAKFDNNQKAQKFLDKARDICGALDDCNCN